MSRRRQCVDRDRNSVRPADCGCVAERLEGRLLLDAVPTGPQFFVNDQRAGNQMYPAVASDDAGNFVVVWENRGDVLEVSARRFSASGAPLGPQFVVAEGRRPTVAMDADGDFVVAWQTEYLTIGAAR